MSSFDFLWQLLDEHGVIPNLKAEALQLWNTFTLEERRAIYRAIREKLRAGKFVNFNPVKAIRDNAPKNQLPQSITLNEYYRRFGTTEDVFRGTVHARQ
jgi:hypothetical protein